MSLRRLWAPGFGFRINVPAMGPAPLAFDFAFPVASASNVTAVPLAAVFTEKNAESGQMERFVYVQQGESFEKRNVKVGVADYSSAEIQEGLAEGEVVSLELPKEEREKKVRQLAGKRPGGGMKLLAGPLSGSATNLPTTSATTAETAAKGKQPTSTGGDRPDSGRKSSR